MVADGKAVERGQAMVDATGVTITFPTPVSSVRLSLADIEELRDAMELAGLAGWDSDSPFHGAFVEDESEGGNCD